MFCFCYLLSTPSEESDCHTDYDEEAVESALSDMELYNRYGEHTEGEETATHTSLFSPRETLSCTGRTVVVETGLGAAVAATSPVGS